MQIRAGGLFLVLAFLFLRPGTLRLRLRLIGRLGTRRARLAPARLTLRLSRLTLRLTRLSLRTRDAGRLPGRAHEAVGLSGLPRLPGLPRRTLRAVLLAKLTRLSASLRAVLLAELARLSASLRTVLLAKLARLPASLRSSARRHVRAVSPYDARRIECRRSWGRCNRRMTAVGSGVQRRISESLLRVLVLHAGRWHVPF